MNIIFTGAGLVAEEDTEGAELLDRSKRRPSDHRYLRDMTSFARGKKNDSKSRFAILFFLPDVTK